jgi:hypothetical protein
MTNKNKIKGFGRCAPGILEQKNVFRISIFNAGPDQQSLVVNKI